MKESDTRLFIVILGVWLLLTIPTIVLLSLAPRETIVANTQGFIVPGGNCSVICGGMGYFTGCEDVGTINVSFYIPGTNTLTSNITTVPSFCGDSSGSMCCQEYINNQRLLWIYVDNSNITHVGLYRMSNNSSYLVLGLILLALSLFPTVSLIWILRHIYYRKFYSRLT